jgi:hypothetical protein
MLCVFFYVFVLSSLLPEYTEEETKLSVTLSGHNLDSERLQLIMDSKSYSIRPLF